jgi:hypothetical protein
VTLNEAARREHTLLIDGAIETSLLGLIKKLSVAQLP